jgi:hypothetical protein
MRCGRRSSISCSRAILWSQTARPRCPRVSAAYTLQAEQRSRCGSPRAPLSRRRMCVTSQRSSSAEAIFVCEPRIDRCRRRWPPEIASSSDRFPRRSSVSSITLGSWHCGSMGRLNTSGPASHITAGQSSTLTCRCLSPSGMCGRLSPRSRSRSSRRQRASFSTGNQSTRCAGAASASPP